MCRPVLALVALAALSLTACPWGKGRSAGNVPIVLISIDTLRADRLPVYGYAKGATPHLDRFAKDAAVFDNAYTHAPLTGPAHASMMTGLLPPVHGVRDNIGYVLDAKHRPLAARLKERGYQTGGAISAWVLRGEAGFGRGFDVFDDAIETADTDAAGSAQRAGGLAVDALERFLDGVSGRPSFSFLHIYEPHSPFTPPEPFRSRHADPYDGEVAAADEIVGRLLESLRRRGLYDEALVIVTSDHGEGLNDHGEEFHGVLLYREVLHVPLLVKWPGNERAGTRVAAPAQLADLLPTILEVVGAPAEKGLDGRSLLQPVEARRRIYAETYYPRVHLGWSELRSVVDERWHYIEGPRPELYDIVADPGERKDLIETEREAMRSMAKALAAHPPNYAAPVAGTPEDMEKLAALGYLGGAVGAPTGPPKNPRDEIHVLDAVKHAFRLSAEGRGAEAVDAFRAVLADHPQFADAQYELGRVLARMGRLEEAHDAYRAATRSSPALAGPLALTLARLTLELGKVEEAEAHARLALTQSAPRAHEVLARIAMHRGDLAGARRELAQAKGDEVAEANARVLEAEILLREGRTEDALRAVEEIERQPAGGSAAAAMQGVAFLRGDALARLGRYAEAEKAFRVEIERFPAGTAAYTRLAIVLGLQRRTYGEVDRLLEQMIAANPRPETADLAAETLRTMGDREGAARWARRAAALRSPSNRPAH